MSNINREFRGFSRIFFPPGVIQLSVNRYQSTVNQSTVIRTCRNALSGGGIKSVVVDVYCKSPFARASAGEGVDCMTQRQGSGV